MKKIVCMALAASMVISGVANASAQGWQGRQEHQGYGHVEGRPMPQPHYQPQPTGWHGGYEHREHEHEGWGRPGPQGFVAYAPAYAPEYAPQYAPAYAPQYDEDNGANVAGAGMVGAVATGILAAILLNHH